MDLKVCAAWTISHLILGSGAQYGGQMADPRLIEALKQAMSSANESLAMQGAMSLFNLAYQEESRNIMRDHGCQVVAAQVCGQQNAVSQIAGDLSALLEV